MKKNLSIKGIIIIIIIIINWLVTAFQCGSQRLTANSAIDSLARWLKEVWLPG